MADIVSPEKRSEMMSGIRGKNTKPEIILRRLLHKMGYRFRLHRKDLLGKPDIVLSKWKTVIFVNGCYWHGHENCHLFRPPKTRTGFWLEKIEGNRSRDKRNYRSLQEEGWKVIIIWECAVDKKSRLDEHQIEEKLKEAFLCDHGLIDIRGTQL